MIPPGGASSAVTNQKYTDLTYYADGTAQAGLVQTVTGPDPDGASGSLQRFQQQFAYDSDGNLTQITDVLPTGNLTRQFTYGSWNRLRDIRLQQRAGDGTEVHAGIFFGTVGVPRENSVGVELANTEFHWDA